MGDDDLSSPGAQKPKHHHHRKKRENLIHTDLLQGQLDYDGLR